MTVPPPPSNSAHPAHPADPAGTPANTHEQSNDLTSTFGISAPGTTPAVVTVNSSEYGPLWQRVVERLGSSGAGRGQAGGALSVTRPIAMVDNTVILAAPHEITRDYIEANLRDSLAHALSVELGRPVRVALTISAASDTTIQGLDHPDTAGNQSLEQAADRAAGQPGNAAAGAGTGMSGMSGDSAVQPVPAPVIAITRAASSSSTRLNPKYTFDTFVIGNSNRLSHAAAVAVAEAPARAYNPLFIYGDSGLGKTHLLHAIGEYAQRLLPSLRTRYVSTEEFTNDFINSLRDDRIQGFQNRYRSVDLLLIDDIQFLERAERTQDQFFHTFNHLHNASKQIVVSSDRPPRQLKTLEDRLRTRFEWGLITDVQAPDLETRIAILRKKAASDGINPPPEVLEFIATRIQSNIRELEGALIRVTAFGSLSGQHVDMSLAEMVLKDLISEDSSAAITVASIMAVCAEYYSVTLDDLTGTSRSRGLVDARQIAMYLCRELTDLSLPKVGEAFGGRDHTTVLHAERKIKTLMSERLTVYNQISELTSRIKLRARG